MKPPGVAVHSETVREFIYTIVAQANAALVDVKRPGFLQISRLHPSSEELVPSRFMLDDIEHIVTAAITDSEAGHNSYIEGRLVAETVRGKARGELKDTTAVFALVIDSDADKQMGWTPTTRPSMTVETSPGNFQFWFFLRQAVSAEVAQKLGERIRAAVHADHDTGNPTQPYRIAGTINYPGKKKIARGRVTVETRLVEFNPEILWTPEEIEQAFPLPEQKTNGGAQAGTAGTAGPADESSIPTDTMQVIRGPVPEQGRGRMLWNVIIVLKEDGWTIDGIITLLEKYPDGVAKKFHGRLRREVERAYRKIKVQQGPTAASAGAVFDPWERHIVPPFPLDILPPAVEDYVSAQGIVIGADPSAVAMSVMGTFSGALHHKLELKLMRKGSWWERPRLWVLLVGDPSMRKTPIFKTVTRPLEHYETHLRVKYDADMRDHELAVEQLEKGGIKPKEPPKPPRYVVWDTTVEKLGELLARSDKGLLVKADEISGWLGSMERYTTSRSDRAFWLKAFDGGAYSVDRIRRGELFIRNLSVSLLGGIQPARLAELHGLTSDGLLQRFIPTMMGPGNVAQDCPADEEAYTALVRDMIFAKPARLIMTEDALAVMDGLRRHLFDLEQASSSLADGFQSFIGKLHGLAGSLALILHMAHEPNIGATLPVEQQTVEDVHRLMCDFILPHAAEFYCGTGTVHGERLRRLGSWILTSGATRILASDLTRNITDCRGLTLLEVNERVSPLVAGGWLLPADTTPVCRSWTVAPQVHIQLAERAKAEAERKAKMMASYATRKAAR